VCGKNPRQTLYHGISTGETKLMGGGGEELIYYHKRIQRGRYLADEKKMGWGEKTRNMIHHWGEERTTERVADAISSLPR